MTKSSVSYTKQTAWASIPVMATTLAEIEAVDGTTLSGRLKLQR